MIPGSLLCLALFAGSAASVSAQNAAPAADPAREAALPSDSEAASQTVPNPAVQATPPTPVTGAAAPVMQPAAETPVPAENKPLSSPPAPPAAVSLPQPAELSKTLFGLIAVLALMLGVVWLMRRMGVVKTADRSIARVVGAVSVGNRERVVVVDIAGQWIVVGVSPGRVNALAQMPAHERIELIEPGAPAASNFSEWLKQTVQQRSGKSPGQN